MACVSQSLFVFFLLSYLLLLISADQGESYTHNCRPFTCKYLHENNIVFPFANITHPKCGLLTVDCSNKTAMIQLDVTDGRQYQLTSLNRSRDHQLNDYVLGIRDQKLSENLSSGICKSITNSTIPHSYEFKQPNHFLTLFKCNHTADIGHKEFEPDGFQCKDNYKFYYHHPIDRIPFGCSIIHLPSKPGSDPYHPIVTAEFELLMHVPPECSQCHEGEVQCDLDPENKFICAKEKEGKKREVLAIALGVGCSAIAIICLGLFMWRSCKKKHAFLGRNTYAVQSSRSDLEGGSTVYFGVHVFTYSELQEATNNFDEEKELGDGGFGTVYYGKLHDGREVAVKRLYEHNCRQVQQFINEVEILTRMRHKNLVSLYGCTSHRSRELLLVYEYIPNGTVADHIHGDRATPGSLPWPTRMNIAIETASALAYLHASEIIHRDVKTNNILLDDNFCVKVADFGLSRLFPIDVTHVSTGPQGTPGYVDPEYHQCYQLTKKSDVYSFGVVLIELISSLPAVDITRHRHEINLANLAINKIEQRAFHELIDPHLGFHSDDEVKSMTISVARLAFQCIQGGQELRPSMVEVLEALEGIQSGKDAGPLNLHPPPSPDCDQVGLLKKKQELPPSPTAVTDNWTSRSSTPNISG